METPTELIDRFRLAAEELEARYVDELLDDEDTDGELRAWIDGNDSPLDWAYSDHITADEWFFISTLYGEMNLDGQRTHIRKYYPTLFVEAADRDMRNFVPDMPEYQGLRSRWMSGRLSKMGAILRDRDITMGDYTESLREIESTAIPDNPMPALDTIIRDHQASGWRVCA